MSNYPIGVVERDTGIGRDTLRIWERRYGFPRPIRNNKGERLYPENQLRRLQRIRRLLDQGLRPGRLMQLDEPALERVEAELLPANALALDPVLVELLAAIAASDTGGIARLLRRLLERQGLRDFILQTMAPLLGRVGEYWFGGRLQVFQEHLLSQQLIGLLSAEITQRQPADAPRVLLATLPGEQHTLGLLMVAGMLSCAGVGSVNLGGEVPMDQIGGAVDALGVGAVGLTFSSYYPYKNLRPHLVELRERVPQHVDIWIGGEGVRRLRKLPPGVTKFRSLDPLPMASGMQ